MREVDAVVVSFGSHKVNYIPSGEVGNQADLSIQIQKVVNFVVNQGIEIWVMQNLQNNINFMKSQTKDCFVHFLLFDLFTNNIVYHSVAMSENVSF